MGEGPAIQVTLDGKHIGVVKPPRMVEKLYYNQSGGKELGPLTWGQLRSLWDRAELTVDTPLRLAGDDTWTTASVIRSYLEQPSIPPPLPPVTQTQPLPKHKSDEGGRGGWGCLAAIVIGILILCGIVIDGIDEKPTVKIPIPDSSSKIQSATAPKPEKMAEGAKAEAVISWGEIDDFYFQGDQTDLQKAEKWRLYKGKKIQWKGRVTSISEGMFGGVNLQVKMNPDTLVSDVMVTLADGEQDKALSFKEGSPISFSGTLNDWSNFLGISVKDGKISP